MAGVQPLDLPWQEAMFFPVFTGRRSQGLARQRQGVMARATGGKGGAIASGTLKMRVGGRWILVSQILSNAQGRSECEGNRYWKAEKDPPSGSQSRLPVVQIYMTCPPDLANDADVMVNGCALVRNSIGRMIRRQTHHRKTTRQCTCRWRWEISRGGKSESVLTV